MLKKIGLKLLSILLSASMVASYCPCYAENKSASDSNTQKNSILKKVLIGAGAVGATGATIISIICIKDLIKNHNLKKQVEIFVNRAPDVFQVEKELITQTDPELLAMSLRKLNDLFDKYKVFIDVLIQHLRSENAKFTLGCYKKDIYSTQLAHANIYEIELNPLYYSKNKAWYTEGHSSPADFDQHKVHNMAHEFGHVIEKIIAHMMSKNFIKELETLAAKNEELAEKLSAERNKANNNNNNPEIIDKASNEYMRLTNELSKVADGILNKKEEQNKVFSDLPKHIKNEVIKIAQNDYDCFETEISEYGKKNDEEWFAEVFAHLECSSQPNELGLAMKDYLEQQESNINE